MSQEHPDSIASPFQLKLKDFCVWIENKFECRLARAPFALRMAIAAAVVWNVITSHSFFSLMLQSPGARAQRRPSPLPYCTSRS